MQCLPQSIWCVAFVGSPEFLKSHFLAATDPANPYGTVLPGRVTGRWNQMKGNLDRRRRGPQMKLRVFPPPRALPALRISLRLTGAFENARGCCDCDQWRIVRIPPPAKSGLWLFLPESEPERSDYARELAKKLGDIAIHRQGRKAGLLIGGVNGVAARNRAFSLPFSGRCWIREYSARISRCGG